MVIKICTRNEGNILLLKDKFCEIKYILNLIYVIQ